jgi:hypothetical protein
MGLGHGSSNKIARLAVAMGSILSTGKNKK